MSDGPNMLELEPTAEALGQPVSRLRRWRKRGLFDCDARLNRRPLFSLERVSAIRKAIDERLKNDT
jgi:hypothetical protein